MDYLDFYFDGFDTPTAGVDISEEWTLSGASTLFVPAYNAVFGRQALRVNPTGILSRDMASTHDYVLVGFRHYRTSNSLVSLRTFVDIKDSATDASRVSIRPTSTLGSWAIYIGATPLFTVAGAYTLSVSAYYEVEVYRHASDGFVGLYRDGNLLGSFTGDTSGIGAAMDRVAFGTMTSTSTVYDYFRDIYFCGIENWSVIGGNNLGPGETAILVPNADEAVEFTPSAGAVNYAMVDDSPHDGDSTYNVSSTASEEDLFSHAGISTESRIFAVLVEYTARKTEAGTMTMLPVLKSGATRSEGDAFVPSDTYRLRTGDVHLTDPADSGAWSEAKVDALQFGVANAAA